jgi:hypothetical protein
MLAAIITFAYKYQICKTSTNKYISNKMLKKLENITV